MLGPVDRGALQEDHLESVLMGVAGALVETWHMLPPLVSVTPVADSATSLDNVYSQLTQQEKGRSRVRYPEEEEDAHQY